MSVNPLNQLMIQQQYTFCGSVALNKASLASEPVFDAEDNRYTATLKNGTILKFSADEQWSNGIVYIDEKGVTIVRDGYLIDVQGSEKDDQIAMFNCLECEVNVEGGGKDTVLLGHQDGYGFNSVVQDDDDVTYINIPHGFKASSDTPPVYGGFWAVRGSNIFTDYDYNRPSGL